VIGSAGYVGGHQTLLPGPDNEIGYAMSPAAGAGASCQRRPGDPALRFRGPGPQRPVCGHYDFNDRSRGWWRSAVFATRFTEQTWVELMERSAPSSTMP
jgi:hypothetical protein